MKKNRYRNRNMVASYLSDKSFDILNRMMEELDMSGSALLELGIICLLAKKMYLSEGQHKTTGEYKCSKELLEYMVNAEVGLAAMLAEAALAEMSEETENV